VDIQATTDTGGGYSIGWLMAGEWTEYTVTVPTAGTYTLNARVAQLDTGATFHVEVDGVNKTGTMTIPATGGYDTWQTVTKTGIALTSGTHIVKLVIDTGGSTSGYAGNINYLQFAAPAGPATVTLTAIPASVGTGDSSTIAWSSTNATACTGTGFSTNNQTSGSVVVTPASTATYSISCTGAGGIATKSVTVTVGSLPALTTIDFPNASFSWTSNGSTCTASGGWTQPVSGTQNVSVPLTSTTYILRCTGPSGPVQRSITFSTSKTTTVSTKFTTGQSVTTTAALNVRSTPSTSGAIVGTQPTGATGTIVGGPVSQGGYWWWQVNYATGADGWSVENWLR
jgi:hypothetical protein